jgi:nucleobase:cation symporter-1, NCS1 family
VAGTVIGFGLVVNSYASWLSWQGYLLNAFGLGGKTGIWASANLGVVVALAIGFIGWYLLGRNAVRRQEATPTEEPASVPA